MQLVVNPKNIGRRVTSSNVTTIFLKSMNIFSTLNLANLGFGRFNWRRTKLYKRNFTI